MNSPNGFYLASGSSDQTIKLWDVDSGAMVTSLQGHRQGVNDIAWSPDSRYLASASDDTTIIIWDTSTVCNLKYKRIFF